LTALLDLKELEDSELQTGKKGPGGNQSGADMDTEDPESFYSAAL